MAVIQGWLAQGIPGAVLNPALSGDLRKFAVDYWPPWVSGQSAVAVRPVTTNLPIATAPRSLAGWRSPHFSDDWYHRVHIKPAVLSAGNVVSETTYPVSLWNAHLLPKTLNAISGQAEGLSVSGPATPPTIVAALAETAWTVRITPDGPSMLDATLVWQFSAANSPSLRVTAARVVAWPLLPDWSEGVLERLAWATEILASPKGAEQRRALRLTPRRGYEARIVVEGTERSMLDLLLVGWGARVFALPVWPDVQVLGSAVAQGATQILCATAHLDFRAGGLAMLRGPTAAEAETVSVQAVQADRLVLASPTLAAWPAGTRLYPARAATLAEQPPLRRLNDRAAEASVSFRMTEPCAWPLVLPSTLYRDVPVLETRPDESEDLTHTWQRLLLELDNTSALPARTDTTGNQGFSVQAHRWCLVGRAERAAWRSLLYALRGRQATLWVPTHAEDLVLLAATSTTIDVTNIGYTRLAQAKVGRRDIRIELADGSAPLHRRITGSSVIDASTERLALDVALGVTLTPGTVRRISFMALCRMDSDEVEIQHETDSEGLARCQVVMRSLRDELEAA